MRHRSPSACSEPEYRARKETKTIPGIARCLSSSATPSALAQLPARIPGIPSFSRFSIDHSYDPLEILKSDGRPIIKINTHLFYIFPWPAWSIINCPVYGHENDFEIMVPILNLTNPLIIDKL